MSQETNAINNRQLKEMLADTALGTLKEGEDFTDPASIRVEFGYLFEIEDHGLEALFRLITDRGVSYFAAQGEQLRILNLNEEQYQAYVESFLEMHDAEPEVYEEDIDREHWLENFLEVYPPEDDLLKPDDELLDFARHYMPEDLLRLWTEYGFGSYGNGLIRIIDPRDYMQSLYDWLGEQDFHKIPIAITAFGDLFYYRDLGEGEHDICMLDIHYRDIHVCAYPYPDFFAGYLLDEEVRDKVLRTGLYVEAVMKYGELEEGECFYFVPALCTGGAEEIRYVQKGDAAVHHQLLLQLGQEE